MSSSQRRRSVFARETSRRVFAAYFLGAVVPLVMLGVVVERHLLSRLWTSGPAELSLGPGGTLAVFVFTALLSLGCFFALRHVLGQTLERNRQLDSIDGVTGLPNRKLFRARLEQAIRHAQGDGALAAMGFVNLDGFKRVNETMGYAAGDDLLRQVGDRIVRCLRLSDVVGHTTTQSALARVGGDEFTFLLTRVAEHEDVVRISKRVIQALDAPFQVGGREVFATASLGVAIYPSDGDDEAAIMRNAQQAMHWAKDRGRNNCQFYSEAMNEETARKMEIEAGLRHAIEGGDFELCFQPVRDATSSALMGAEVLIRWKDPDGNEVGPEDFIPIAEEAGLINKIGEWVLNRACAQAEAWRRAGLEPPRLAVNVSGYQIRQPGFAHAVNDALQRTGTSAAMLDLEITESTIMHDDDITNDTIRELDELGVGLVLDDFGTGYSSLSYLKRFPVSRVKVDRSFIVGLETSEEDRALTGAIISMAHSLGLEVIAESVETLEQIQLLRGLECDHLQGYLLGKPVRAPDFERVLTEEKRARSGHSRSSL